MTERSTTFMPSMQVRASSMLSWQNTFLAPHPNKLTKSADILRPKPNTSFSNSVHQELPYVWRRTENFPEQMRQATDRSYRHTYGDQLTPRFELKAQKTNLLVKQKTSVEEGATLKSTNQHVSTALSLPTNLVTKIYDNLHQSPQNTKSAYVIRNMRRTTPASKPANLPTIVPFYNIQLIRCMSKVLTEDLFSKSQREEVSPPESIQRPMAAERKYYSPTSGRLIKSLRKSSTRAALSSTNNGVLSLETLPSSNRIYKSAEAYNRLLASGHSRKIGETSFLRHPTANVTYNRAEQDRTPSPSKHSENRVEASPIAKPSAPASQPIKHITLVKVKKRAV